MVETVIFVLLSIPKKGMMGNDRKSKIDIAMMTIPNLSLQLYFFPMKPKIDILKVFPAEYPMENQQ